MTALLPLSPTEIWHKNRHASQAEFAGKCAFALLIMLPLKIATGNGIPSPFVFTTYWNSTTAQKIRVRILSSQLNNIINDTSWSRESGAFAGPMWWHKEYSISELARFGFIEKSHANEIARLIKEYKIQTKIIKRSGEKIYYFVTLSKNTSINLKFLDKLKETYFNAEADIKRIEQTWIKFRDKELSARLPNPQISLI